MTASRPRSPTTASKTRTGTRVDLARDGLARVRRLAECAGTTTDWATDNGCKPSAHQTSASPAAPPSAGMAKTGASPHATRRAETTAPTRAARGLRRVLHVAGLRRRMRDGVRRRLRRHRAREHGVQVRPPARPRLQSGPHLRRRRAALARERVRRRRDVARLRHRGAPGVRRLHGGDDTREYRGDRRRGRRATAAELEPLVDTLDEYQPSRICPVPLRGGLRRGWRRVRARPATSSSISNRAVAARRRRRPHRIRQHDGVDPNHVAPASPRRTTS